MILKIFSVVLQFGKVVFKRRHSVGKRLLITHGDDFDEIMPRNQLFMKAFKMLHKFRVRLGARPVRLRHESTVSGSNFDDTCKLGWIEFACEHITVSHGF
jgi:hypothetical protein